MNKKLAHTQWKMQNKTLVATGDNVFLEFELPFRRCHS
jgi:hypothetical protein